MRFVLPYPPSINHYWRNVPAKKGRKAAVLISEEGREYRERVARAIVSCDQFGDAARDDRLAVRLRIHPPDRRRRDLDNVQKPLLDALGKSRVYVDDSQIDWLLTERRPVLPDGAAIVEIAEARQGELLSHLLDCKRCRDAAIAIVEANHK